MPNSNCGNFNFTFLHRHTYTHIHTYTHTHIHTLYVRVCSDSISVNTILILAASAMQKFTTAINNVEWYLFVRTPANFKVNYLGKNHNISGL